MMKPAHIILVMIFLIGWSWPAAAQEESEDSDRVWLITGAPNLKKIRRRIRDWDQSVLGFRKAHNFAYSLGPMRGRWRVKRFNNQVNQTHVDSGWYTKVGYNYHQQLYEGFGYFLGTAAGYWQPTKLAEDFNMQSAAMLPGVRAGFALNMTPGFRLIAGLEYYLERWNSLSESDEVEEDDRVSVTSRALDLGIGLDIFFRLKWGVRFEYHRRYVDYVRPENPSDKPVDFRVDREDDVFAMGLVHHLM